MDIILFFIIFFRGKKYFKGEIIEILTKFLCI